jgi:hypothetical protein
MIDGQVSRWCSAAMDWLMTRLVALGAALLITLVLLVLTGVASSYIAERTKPPPPKPREYIIDLQSTRPH